MAKIFAAIALLVLLAVGRGAGAAETTGWITHLDQQADQIVLDDGRIFVVSEEINFSSLKDGVKVRIRYDDIGGDRIATEILLAPDAPQAGQPALHCAPAEKDRMANAMSVPLNTHC